MFSMLPTPQPPQLLEDVEIAVAVQQHVVAFDAEGGDQHVQRAAHRDAGRAQAAVVARGFEREIRKRLAYWEGLRRKRGGG